MFGSKYFGKYFFGQKYWSAGKNLSGVHQFGYFGGAFFGKKYFGDAYWPGGHRTAGSYIPIFRPRRR